MKPWRRARNTGRVNVPFELPKPDEHSFIVGRNGSGKTQLGAFMLSESDLEQRPHIIVDFKRDELLNSIPHIKYLKKPVAPKEPGVYMFHAEIEDPRVEDLFWSAWSQNNTHIHVDEMYMVNPRSKALNAILTQGRSKRVSMTSLSQRPTYCSRWVVSEASNFGVFDLNDERDHKTIQAFIPFEISPDLKRFHSHWFNVKTKTYSPLLPCPDGDSILETFDQRLRPKRRYF